MWAVMKAANIFCFSIQLLFTKLVFYKVIFASPIFPSRQKGNARKLLGSMSHGRGTQRVSVCLGTTRGSWLLEDGSLCRHWASSSLLGHHQG